MIRQWWVRRFYSFSHRVDNTITNIFYILYRTHITGGSQSQIDHMDLSVTLDPRINWYGSLRAFTSTCISNSCTEKMLIQIEWDTIVVTGLLSFLTKWNSIWFKNRKETCHHEHIPFSLKGNGIQVFSVWSPSSNVSYIRPQRWYQIQWHILKHPYADRNDSEHPYNLLI